MDFAISSEGIILKNFRNFDPGQTFDCGQCFRWIKNGENEYQGISYNQHIKVKKVKDSILFEKTGKNEFLNLWSDYFDLNTDYQKIGEHLAGIHPVLDEARHLYSGIRILKQEPWETLCSFIISQNNNIPRIKKIISALCRNFGSKVSGGYGFPDVQKISLLKKQDLEPIKCGFRAKYILDAAHKVASGEIDLKEIPQMPLKQARKSLTLIKGVGPKVAECVLLYGMHRLDAFPVDIWMKKVMYTFFPGKTPEIFGKYAGVAQQYLYHYSRMHPDKIKNL